MKKPTSIILLVILVSFCFLLPTLTPVYGDPEGDGEATGKIVRNSFGELQKSFDWQVGELAQIPTEEETQLFSSKAIKSTKKAFLLSLVIPGAGEYYCKSWIKGGVFTAAEIAFWVSYFSFLGKGDDKTDEYEAFADEHWIEDDYWDWLLESGKDTTWWESPESTWATEILPHDKDHDYYEMIGKYAWFLVGWDDFTEADKDTLIMEWNPFMTNRDEFKDSLVTIFNLEVSANRKEYASMRKDANDMYSIAKYFIGASIVNHILSAFDAAWSAKRFNDRFEGGFTRINVKPRLAYKHGEVYPEIAITYKF
ncbi:hypothetical protein JXI42_01485 [bacterium]|nr:hypothetical protein [bacterium]